MAQRKRLGSRVGKGSWALAGLVLLVGQLAPRTAEAVLVLSKSARVSSESARVVALREGDHTVLSIEARVRGPAAEVALLTVAPPAALAVSTMKPQSLEPLSRVTGPRWVEYWEQDPCEFHDVPFASDGSYDASLRPAVTASAAATPEFVTEVSPAKTGADVVASLKRDGYLVPDPLAAVLDGYLKAGANVVIARLDTSKLSHPGDAIDLPPLRIHYQSASFTLPTRLFAVGGPGAALPPDGGGSPRAHRELVIDVLAPGVRYEAGNQPNVAVPTNLNVSGAVRSTLPAFYRSLLDRTFERSGTAIITEYAWRASACEVCAAPLSTADVAAFGATLLPSAAGKQHEVLIEAASVAARPDGPAELRPALMECYGKALASHAGLGGDVALAVEVDADGAIASATPTVNPRSPGPADDALVACATASLRAAKAWKAGAKGAVTVTFSPVSRAFFGDLVLTALRGRYDAIPDRDLMLVPGRAIEGGREMGTEGSAPERVYAARAGNDFQARYVVRHPFAGTIPCAAPTRGVWGPSPPDASGPGEAGAAAAGGAIVDASAVDFAAFAIQLGPPAAPSSTAPAPSTVASAEAPATTTPAPHADCGACAVGSGAGEAPSGTWASFAALVLVGVGRRGKRDRATP
jgi:hypothetical protein